MAHSAGFSKKPLNNNPLWERASAEFFIRVVQMGSNTANCSKWAAKFAKDEIEIGNLLRAKPPLVEPSDPKHEIEIMGETEAQKKNLRSPKPGKRVGKGVLCNSFRRDEA